MMTIEDTDMRDTIDMAREAGLFTHKEVQEELKAFEALVRADERKQALNDASHLAAPVQEPVALQVIRGELCYKSQDDDQSYGMWCPVTPHTDLPFVDGTEFYTTPLSVATPLAAQRQWVDMPELELLGAYEEEQQGRWGDHVRGLLNVQAKLKEKNT
jgi:hypothetical protein